MKVLVAGAQGQLGRELINQFAANDEVLGASSADLDVTKQYDCLELARTFTPDVIINAAAYTRVDDCETQVERAYAVNALGARNIALAAAEVGARVVYVSTDYVFDGNGQAPYGEFDPTSPLNVYGRTKLAGEQLTRAMTYRHYIVRTSWLCGRYGSNFVKTMARLAAEKPLLEVVTDQRGCPTFALDLAVAIKQLVHTESYGTLHVTNTGDCSWYDFAAEIVKQIGSATPVLPTTSDRFVRPARRPPYSVLGHTAWVADGFAPLRPWQEALADLLEHLKLKPSR